MIKEALQYIVGLSAPVVQEIGNETYSDKPLHRVDYTPLAEPIQLSTLESLGPISSPTRTTWGRIGEIPCLSTL